VPLAPPGQAQDRGTVLCAVGPHPRRKGCAPIPPQEGVCTHTPAGRGVHPHRRRKGCAPTPPLDPLHRRPGRTEWDLDRGRAGGRYTDEHRGEHREHRAHGDPYTPGCVHHTQGTGGAGGGVWTGEYFPKKIWPFKQVAHFPLAHFPFCNMLFASPSATFASTAFASALCLLFDFILAHHFTTMDKFVTRKTPPEAKVWKCDVDFVAFFLVLPLRARLLLTLWRA